MSLKAVATVTENRLWLGGDYFSMKESQASNGSGKSTAHPSVATR